MATAIKIFTVSRVLARYDHVCSKCAQPPCVFERLPILYYSFEEQLRN